MATKSEAWRAYLAAVEGGCGIEYAARLASEVARREREGRSVDCDEYRALLNYAKTVSRA